MKFRFLPNSLPRVISSGERIGHDEIIQRTLTTTKTSLVFTWLLFHGRNLLLVRFGYGQLIFKLTRSMSRKWYRVSVCKILTETDRPPPLYHVSNLFLYLSSTTEVERIWWSDVYRVWTVSSLQSCNLLVPWPLFDCNKFSRLY